MPQKQAEFSFLLLKFGIHTKCIHIFWKMYFFGAKLRISFKNLIKKVKIGNFQKMVEHASQEKIRLKILVFVFFFIFFLDLSILFGPLKEKTHTS